MRAEWTEYGLDQLADIVVTLNLDDQDAVERAVIKINTELARDPWELGESRASMAHRAWFVPPLVVQFQIFPGDAIALVQHVAYRKPK
jgi:hypothetical protein